MSISVAGFLLALWLILLTVRRLRPQRFRLKAMLTKWITLDLEMEAPEMAAPPASIADGSGPPVQHDPAHGDFKISP
jgi:hypothetical protein